MCRPRGAQGATLHSTGALAYLQAPGPAQHSGLCAGVRECSTECGHLRASSRAARPCASRMHSRRRCGNASQLVALWLSLSPLSLSFSLCACVYARFAFAPLVSLLPGFVRARQCRTRPCSATLARCLNQNKPKTLSLQP